MSEQSIAYHSIIIGDKNTWDDWHLIPSSRPVFNPPTVKTNYVEVPGAQGALDLTEASFGSILYNNREGSIEFIVVNDTWEQTTSQSAWIIAKENITNYLQGKKFRAILEDDPGYYYEGRFSVNEWRSNNDGTWSTITIDYNLDPFKYSVNFIGDDFDWDNLNFVRLNPEADPEEEPYYGYVGDRIAANWIKLLSPYALGGNQQYSTKTVTFDPGLSWQVPEFISDSGLSFDGTASNKYWPDLRVVYAGKEYKIRTDGVVCKFPSIILKAGANKLIFRNYSPMYGRVRVRYRDGRL